MFLLAELIVVDILVTLYQSKETLILYTKLIISFTLATQKYVLTYNKYAFAKVGNTLSK